MKQTKKKWLILAAGDGETRWLRDHSRHRRDAQLKGDRCHVDGTLNLTDNISTDFDTNGYLLLPLTANEIDEIFESVTTGIDFLQNEESQAAKGEWFDLSGRRISHPTQKGIFIINHKKWIR